VSATVRLSLRAAKAIAASGVLTRMTTSHSAMAELDAAIAKASRASATRRTLRKPKEAKRKAKREARGEVGAAVMDRAHGRCECCGSGDGLLELEHFFGRARAESLETCWALCRACHRSKTDNDPSAAWWLKRFARHCEHYRYSEAEARARKRLAFVEARGAP
jgi:5-methylcytosine-specific restriction endonuclease McrA